MDAALLPPSDVARVSLVADPALVPHTHTQPDMQPGSVAGPHAIPIPRPSSESSLGDPWARPLLSSEPMPALCPAAPTYQRREPERSVLYRTIQARLETFLAQTAGDAERSGLPGFVKREFEAYLRGAGGLRTVLSRLSRVRSSQR